MFTQHRNSLTLTNFGAIKCIIHVVAGKYGSYQTKIKARVGTRSNLPIHVQIEDTSKDNKLSRNKNKCTFKK